MSFYDHFYSEQTKATKLGKYFVRKENLFYLSLINRFINHGKSKRKINIFEVGTGKGGFAYVCQKKNIKYRGIEANKEQVKNLQAASFDVKLQIVPPIDIASKSSDVFFANQVIEHMPHSNKALEFVAEAHRILTPGGLIFLGAPDYLLYKEDFFDNDYTHNYITTLRRTEQLLTNKGFTVVYKNYNSQIFRGNILSLIISKFIRVIYYFKIPLIFLSRARANKIKYSLLRSFIVIAKKNDC